MSVERSKDRGTWAVVTCDYCGAKEDVEVSPMFGGEAKMRALDLEDNQAPAHICQRCEDRAIDAAARMDKDFRP